MKVKWTPDAKAEFDHWNKTDAKVVQRIRDLIKAIQAEPFRGLGKPEPLLHNLKGYWSRRITGGHRLVYRVEGTPPDQVLTIVQCRFHY
jgi:toxin YoeB